MVAEAFIYIYIYIYNRNQNCSPAAVMQVVFLSSQRRRRRICSRGGRRSCRVHTLMTNDASLWSRHSRWPCVSNRQTGKCFCSKPAGARCLNSKTSTCRSRKEQPFGGKHKTMAAWIDPFLKMTKIEFLPVSQVCGEGKAESVSGQQAVIGFRRPI